MLVELDVFSGRPNPCWELDELGTQELRRLQSRLAATRQASVEPPGLGYRGFLYSDGTGRVRVFRGYLQTTRAVLADPSFSVERYLLDQLPAEYAALSERIATEVGRTSDNERRDK